MAEMFTPRRLKLPPSLYKCLATTNLIESPQSGVARRTANVKYGVIREWSSVGLLRPGHSPKTASEKISGHRDLWALSTILGRKTETEISQKKVA